MIAMKRSTGFVAFVICLAALGSSAAPANDKPREAATLLVVVGAAGDEEYGKIFADEAEQWRKTAASGDVRLTLIGAAGESEPAASGSADKDRLLKAIAEEAKTGDSPLWLVFIGHGTFDGRTAAFNLRGPDLTSDALQQALKDVRRPTIVVDTTAASAPFLTALSAPGRVIITATKSGQERNYARFGRYFAKRIGDPAADLDKDEQTSLFEAFLAASRDTAEFYKSEGRIATEHPLLDDDGDGRGVRGDFFQRGKLVKRPSGETAVDGERARRLHLSPAAADRALTAAQLAERDRLEDELAALRARKAELSAQDYLTKLERVLVAIARISLEKSTNR
ncbi:MAG: hypothetical protein QM775_08470 [Pirellulales bacterium]